VKVIDVARYSRARKYQAFRARVALTWSSRSIYPLYKATIERHLHCTYGLYIVRTNYGRKQIPHRIPASRVQTQIQSKFRVLHRQHQIEHTMNGKGALCNTLRKLVIQMSSVHHHPVAVPFRWIHFRLSSGRLSKTINVNLAERTAISPGSFLRKIASR
jgi:hypothetical protein